MVTWRKLQNKINHTCYCSLKELKNTKQVLMDDSWISAKQEELKQFKKNNV